MVQAETSFDVYVAFSDELQRAQAGQLAVLDDDDGLVTRWSIICDQKLQTLSVDLNPDEVEAWTLERNTWQLVQALYAERLSEHRETTPSPQGSTSKNPYTPPLSVVQNIIEANKDLGELSAIRDWLHSIPTSLNPAEIRRGYLPYTKNKLKQAKRTGVKPPRGLAEELDPDAVLRDPTVRLDTEDAAYERAMLRSLFEYVRAGELDLAIDMCRQSDQSWRAASLSGGKLWWDPSLAPGEEGYEDDMETAMEEKRAKGTLNRRLWKRMCRKLAVAPNLDPYERAIYGAISGDTASVLPVCTSWEDHVWTHVNALFEANVEAGLWASAEGRYWSRGAIKSVELGTARLDVEDPLLGSAGRGVSVRTELEDVFDRMLKRGAGDLEDSANDPYHVAQTHLIVGQVDSMLRTFVDRLEQAALETSQETLARLLRFFAHLVLVLRLLKQPLPDEAANLILEAYVNVLEANNENESLIAFYASNLESDSAIESYARFLLTFGTETDLASRRAALLQAHEHGLDLAQIARRTVELILADLSQDLPSMSADSEFDAYARLDPRQLELIRSLEWLTFDHSTYPDALSQANALTRYFLSSDKPHAARELLFHLPDDLLRVVAAAAAPEAGGGEEAASQVREYVDYASLFGCLEKHAKWSGVWAMKPRPGAPKLDVAQFKDGVIKLVDDFYFAAIEIFESEWLKLEPSADVAVPGRLHELSQIRQQLIPHLILRLHTTLYDTRDLIPSNLQRALDLANIVADERYQLYLEFVSDEGNALGVYLEQVRLMPPSTNYDPGDPGSYVPPDLPPAPTSVASRFVSETTLEAAKIQREADWKAAYARLGQEPPKKEEEEGEKYDGRSLWEKLQEHKDKKQEAFDEQLKFKNQFRALDEDEISFLDSLTDDNHEEEAKKAQAIKDELKGFREAVISRQSAIPPPVISSSLSPSIAVASTSPTTSSISLQKATAPSAAPPKKPAAGTAGGSKKKDFQKKFLAGVVVKKKPQHHATGVSPNAGKRSAEEGKEGESATEAKKRKVREGETGA